MNEETKTEQPKPAARPPITVDKGALVPTDALELGAMLGQIAAGGGFPERFDTREKRLAAYHVAQALMGKQWQLALNNIAIIKGQMSIYGELPGALAERTGEVQEKELFVVDRNYVKICLENKNLDAEAWAGVCRIQRKGRAMKEFFYTKDEAIAAGQFPPKRRDGSINHDSPWAKFFKIMIMRKALAQGVNFEFSEAKVGVPIAEYDFDTMLDDNGQDVNTIRDVGGTDKAQAFRDDLHGTGESHEETVIQS